MVLRNMFLRLLKPFVFPNFHITGAETTQQEKQSRRESNSKRKLQTKPCSGQAPQPQPGRKAAHKESITGIPGATIQILNYL